MGVNFCFRFVVFLSNRWTAYGIDIVGILRRNYRLEMVNNYSGYRISFLVFTCCQQGIFQTT